MAGEGIAFRGVMDINTALQEVLKIKLIHNGWLMEFVKPIFVFSLPTVMHVKLVETLCAEHQINLIKVDDNKKLSEWVGLCKIDTHKVVGCSCIVVKDYGKESQAKDIMEEYLNARNE